MVIKMVQFTLTNPHHRKYYLFKNYGILKNLSAETAKIMELIVPSLYFQLDSVPWKQP